MRLGNSPKPGNDLLRELVVSRLKVLGFCDFLEPGFGYNFALLACMHAEQRGMHAEQRGILFPEMHCPKMSPADSAGAGYTGANFRPV